MTRSFLNNQHPLGIPPTFHALHFAMTVVELACAFVSSNSPMACALCVWSPKLCPRGALLPLALSMRFMRLVSQNALCCVSWRFVSSNFHSLYARSQISMSFDVSSWLRFCLLELSNGMRFMSVVLPNLHVLSMRYACSLPRVHTLCCASNYLALLSPRNFYALYACGLPNLHVLCGLCFCPCV